MDKDKDIQHIRRYLNGTYSREDIDPLTESLHCSKQEEVIDKLAREVWEEAQLQPEASEQEREKYRKEAANLLKRYQPKQYRLLKWAVYSTLGIAASLLLFWGGYELKQSWESEHIVWKQVQTGYGEKKELTLADGSMIILNACSELQYPEQFSGEQRSVQLKGEAYFKITPNPKQPFRVHTPEFQVEVLGTAFNIKSYANDQIQSVEVESGKVQVDMPEDRIRLKKQEQIYLNCQSGEYSKTKRTEDKVAVWRKGTLHFHQTPLVDVARELERRFHCHITFRSGQTFDNLISGEHDSQSLESILESLHYVCGIQYEKQDDQIILYKQ